MDLSDRAVAHGEMVEGQLEYTIEHRSRTLEPEEHPDTVQGRASRRRIETQREKNRALWSLHFEHLAQVYRRIAADYEARAASLAQGRGTDHG